MELLLCRYLEAANAKLLVPEALKLAVAVAGLLTGPYRKSEHYSSRIASQRLVEEVEECLRVAEASSQVPPLLSQMQAKVAAREVVLE